MPTDIKPWYLSRTIIGILVSILAKGLAVWGYQISPDLLGDIVTLALTLVSFGGDALAIFGRVRATKAIGRKPGDGPTPLGIGSAMALLLLVGALAGPLAACASREADSPAQRIYALEADYQNVQRAVLAYLASPAALPAVAARLKDAEALAHAAVRAAREAARKGEDVGLPAALAAAREAVERVRRYLEEEAGQ